MNSPPTTPTVAAVVVTYHRPKDLAAGIEAMRGEGVEDVIVVDNGSGGEVSGVTYIDPGSNTGAAGGFALGIENAVDRGFDAVWLFNDDDRPMRGSLSALRGCLEGDVGAVGSWVDDGRRIVERGAAWRGRQCQPERRPGRPYDVDVTTFSGLLVRTAVLEEVGLPRSDYFMMMEEIELMLRVRRAGYRVQIIGRDLAIAAAAGGNPPWRDYYQTRNHLRMALDHRSPMEVAWWTVRTTRFVLRAATTRDWRRLCLRLMGARDGAIGRMGRIIEPAGEVTR